MDSVYDDRVKFVGAVIDEGVKFVEDQIAVLLEGKLCYDTSSTMRAHRSLPLAQILSLVD